MKIKYQLKKIYPLFFLLLLVTRINAQESPVGYTLEKCIGYALNRNNVIQQHNSEIGESEYKRKEQQSQLLPQVSINSQYDRYLEIPSTILPGEIIGQPGEKISVQAGTKNVLDLSARLEQVIYDPGLFQGIKIARSNVELQQLRKSLTEEDVIYNVCHVFYELMSSEEELRVVDTISLKQEELFQIIRQKVNEGASRPIDLNRIQVNINNLKLRKKGLINVIFQQKNYLKTLLGMPIGDLFEINYTSSELIEIADIFPSLAGYNYIGLDILEKQKDIIGIQIKQEKQKYLPVLSGLIAGGYQFQSDKFRITKDPWASSVVVGLRLRFPIFDGFAKRNKIKQLRFQQQNVDFQIRDKQLELDANQRNAINQLQTSYESINEQKNNLLLAEDNYNKTNLLYQEGLIDITDVFNTESTLFNSKVSYVKELINYKKSHIDLLKSQGRLRNNIKAVIK